MKQILFICSLLASSLCQVSILISSSIWYKEMRQNVNILSVYNYLKKFNTDDQDIQLWIPYSTFTSAHHNSQAYVSLKDNDNGLNLVKNSQNDFKHGDVSVKNVLNALRGRYQIYTAQRKRVKLSSDQNILLYLTGHGGQGYFIIQSLDYIEHFDFKKAFKELEYFNLYKEAIVFVDSCIAYTQLRGVNSRDTTVIGSSSFQQKSYSYGYDQFLSVPKSDRFTYYLSQFLKKEEEKYYSDPNINDLMKEFDFEKLNGNARARSNGKDLSEVKLYDFLRQKKDDKVKKSRKIEESLIDF